MNNTAKLLVRCACGLFGAGLFFSCAKTPELPGTVSLTIVNTLKPSLIVNFNQQDTILYTARGINQIIARNSALAFSFAAGSQLVNLRELTTMNPPHAWKAESMLKLAFGLPAGAIGSLFIAGTSAAPDTLFVSDSPVHFQAADSSMGIRFVNLSGDKVTVAVNLQGKPTGSETAGLPYKGVTGFMRYPAIPSVQRYVFEVRESASGKLLASNTINNPGATGGPNQWRFHNFTLVYSGAPGAANNPPAAFIVKNY